MIDKLAEIKKMLEQMHADDRISSLAWSEILSAVEALQQEQSSAWKSIDSAPRDGTKVLICNRGGYDMFVGSYVDGGEDEESYWQTHGEDCTMKRYYSPMYWMPLPAPPVNGGES